MRDGSQRTTTPRWVVLKFGGTSVASLACWKTIASIIRERQQEGLRPVVVCSAVAGITNELELMLRDAIAGNHEARLAAIAARHRALAKELGLAGDAVDPLLEKLARLITGAALIREVSPRLQAQVLAMGELLSTSLGAVFLTAAGLSVAWHDARDHLVVLDQELPGRAKDFLSASCDDAADPVLMERFAHEPATAIITQGFIARDAGGDTFLLGRGGSDVSASYFAAKLAASRCEIWTDVPGMYTANPHQVPTAQLITALDYDEAQEIASAGAKVLHPRCIPPLRRHGIPLHVRCVPKPAMEGTIVSAAGPRIAGVKAITARRGITLISMDTIAMWQQVGFLADVFACFKQHGFSVDLVSTSEANVTATLDKASNPQGPEVLRALLRDLAPLCNARAIEGVATVSLVGRNIRAQLHELAPALEVFEEQRVYLLSQAASDLNLTFVVDEEQADRLVQELHGHLFSQRERTASLGPRWQECAADESAAPEAEAWWRVRREELLAEAARKSPLYVYDAPTLGRSIAALRELTAIDRLFYALKANRHPVVLAACHAAGLGFECVSPGEIDHVRSWLPGIAPSRILFTPNFAPRAEYEEALAQGVWVTLDNLHPLARWPELFRDREVLVRIDPGQGQGHHKHVKTAGAKSKFGVSLAQLDELAALVKGSGARVVGLHAHVGSNIFDPATWSRTALLLASVAERFASVRFLDLGGGLGVVERAGQRRLDLQAVGEALGEVKAVHPEYELWLEPGRFVCAEAGVLLARVTQIKQKGDYCYVGVDTGMNTLLRPALYGASHEIVNLTKLAEEPRVRCTVVGPICESGDVLGYDRLLADPQEGDVLLIATTGAYGRVMSSDYNLRLPAEERVLEAR
jgi:bifunctional diaminopimelate decarboxylase / aspartate kinase